ncbi:ulp1 protease family, C-terminal catalytic domain-containing protein [Tanacetum coccineum]
MDRRKWMYNVERVTPEYINGLSEFIKTAEDHQVKTGKARISCPCKECAHFICHDDIETIRYHLFKHGFTNNYTWWKHHGEARLDCNDVVLESNVNINDDNCGSSNQNINDMLHDAEHNAELDMEKLQQLFVESEKPLYAGCTNFTKLSAVLQLLTVKAEYGLSDVGFNKLLELFNKMLPKNNELPTSMYQAKKINVSVGIGSP